MSIEASRNKVNGINSDEMEVDEPAQKIVQFNPLPQRVPRLNRRGFYMSCRDKQAKSLLENVNSQKDAVSSTSIKSKAANQEKISTPLSNRIIKLNISKKSPNSETEKCLKRNGNDQQTNSECAQKPPPKKKHKPITWP
ncbi:uncharacterized protein [Parasteatoda tepidariorum]|uniref:uncharacterized protein isoform X1 n=2 Tax=Parasteatoda tepidariorum TaxID=114398 RepID=UPI001C71E6CA|nr:uncharacterized protein LOC107437350 isoform X1 [Parasteatoda tepidariorum]XP_015904808.2 uncharacterized protein LOC107437350 isoform X1 [Parasteatoda tepidariorum]XP_042910930.1 uncharacterized protein LOC107437350 isoform X1 [Parasteatoda tepidariorum]